MFFLKRLTILILTAVIIIPAVSAQRTVEESYYMESIEIMIITEAAKGITREQKLVSLEYIGEAIERGNTDDRIRETLEFLTSEGTRSVTRENGRVVNNFPDIRRHAARYLGEIGTEEARKSLIGILEVENEPIVLQETFKSLGDIGTNANNETVRSIARVLNFYTNTNPDNLMALSAIDAFEKIARKNGGINSIEVINCLTNVSTGLYTVPIRERARQLLADLRSYR
ncbi:MAG: HEAT repeat domain-containing protein [Treponema sp.]|jgi:hypothetical protein|nr:HEAT repeat domain-containing protein [Treponema sp.]